MRTALLLALSSLLACAACSAAGPALDDRADPEAACSFPLEWGRLEGGALVPFHDGDEVSVGRALDGARVLDTAARLRTDATAASFRFFVSVEGHAPSSQETNTLALAADPDACGAADHVPVFFDGAPWAYLEGQRAHLVATAFAGNCAGQADATVVLRGDAVR